MNTERCFDQDCLAGGCMEHPSHAGDHTYEMHHEPEEHVGNGPCRCGDPLYGMVHFPACNDKCDPASDSHYLEGFAADGTAA